MVAGMDAGADDFVRKPLNFDELHARIRAGERVLQLEQTLQIQNQRLTQLSDALQQAHSRLNSDLVMAGKMQQNLLPPPDGTIYDVRFSHMYLPSLHVSGDLLNYFRLDEKHIGLYSIDVAGHGVAAAMMSFTLNQLLSPLMNTGCPLKRPVLAPPYYELMLPPSKVIEMLNQQFESEAENFLFFTMLYGVINTEEKTLSFCQAGHPSPLYIKAGEAPTYLGKNGFPVGLFSMSTYDSVNFNYTEGDRFFLYSDGITECANPDGEAFGAERLKEFFGATVNLPMAEVLKHLRERICEWNGGEAFEDDISVLALEV
jgi:sigma-B regulation protein RsbU (phosphoserine phosphatase)